MHSTSRGYTVDLVERVVDLDLAAHEIETRRADWERAGFTVSPVTWRDEDAPWPVELQTDRTAVSDPDSVGVSLDYDEGPAAEFVLFRGGWADVDIVDFQIDEAVALPADNITSPQAFGDLLDRTIARVRQSLQGSS